VSYDRKHNQANREDNRDGAGENLSWNCGLEGPTEDTAIRAVRARQQRNFLATLLLSQGVPMLRAGDELGVTQQGNNNAYCQDNALTWIDWSLDAERAALLAFTRRLTGLVRRHPGLRRADYFAGALVATAPGGDLVWYAPSGRPMRDEDWHDRERRALGVRLRAAAPDAGGGADVDVLILLSAGSEPTTLTLPEDVAPSAWAPLLDTAQPDDPSRPVEGGRYELGPRSLVMLAPTIAR
jgi:isoamylase